MILEACKSIGAILSCNGSCFGSIKKSDIAESLSKEGLSVDAKFIKIGSIKELGTYEAEIRLHREVSVVISFNVVKE